VPPGQQAQVVHGHGDTREAEEEREGEAP
jgi:hypothetical protein